MYFTIWKCEKGKCFDIYLDILTEIKASKCGPNLTPMKISAGHLFGSLTLYISHSVSICVTDLIFDTSNEKLKPTQYKI